MSRGLTGPADLEAGVDVARLAVQGWFPDARAAWLGGSVVRGTATSSSDLDVTVLLDAAPAPFRDTRDADGWPVELFVQTPASLAHYRAVDRARRQPSTARLVGESVVLLDQDGWGRRLQLECRAEVAAGPEPLGAREVDAHRYALTCLLDDLTTGEAGVERTAVAVAAWDGALRLQLGLARRWTGTGKGLVREVVDLDASAGTSYASTFDTALGAAVGGDVGLLTTAVADVLERAGGRLLVGYRLGGSEA